MKISPYTGFYISEEKRFPLFCLLWFSYFAANLGRLSYITVMIEIISREGFSAAEAGLVGTGFFAFYGAGQIVSGFLGDRLPPYRVVFTGLLCTALANLVMGFAQTGAQMLVVWCVNGAVQSVLWPPILRVIVEYYPKPEREKACVNISTTYPAATLFSYAACAGILLVLPWRAVFFIFSLVVFTAAALWGVMFGKMEHCRTVRSPENEGKRNGPRPGEGGAFGGLPYTALAFICASLVVQGALRDGLMTWIPSYMAQSFNLRSSAAILSTGILPVVNLAGIYGCQLLFRFIKDEVRTSFCLFCVSALSVLALKCFGSSHIAAALAAFAVITACMMGINMMLVSFVPAYFSRLGMVSFFSGLTNSLVYLGSSLSSFSIGAVVEAFGWNALFLILGALALLSALLCLAACPFWSAFVKRQN
ncbi:MAG: MFS transporter [Spirochaetaceae bacterium]|jgi:OPA family glycerol-3-phosphate transporter-like MFS transporter|nr:MFS transporter [Spirochaetaceae bacterium]